MKERIEHSLRLAVVTSMVVGRPQLGTVSNTVRWPRTTTIRATVAARITMALAARVVLPANQAPVIMVMTQATNHHASAPPQVAQPSTDHDRADAEDRSPTTSHVHADGKHHKH